MGDMADDQREVIEKAWKVLNLQADTIMKLTQAHTEIWKVAAGGLAAGGALVAATAAIKAALLHTASPDRATPTRYLTDENAVGAKN
jgi:hypothetical protein